MTSVSYCLIQKLKMMFSVSFSSKQNNKQQMDNRFRSEVVTIGIDYDFIKFMFCQPIKSDTSDNLNR